MPFNPNCTPEHCPAFGYGVASGYNAPMRRWFQFSVTWLVIALLVIAAFFGGISVGRRCYEIENEKALAEVRNERVQMRRLADEARKAARRAEAEGKRIESAARLKGRIQRLTPNRSM